MLVSSAASSSLYSSLGTSSSQPSASLISSTDKAFQGLLSGSSESAEDTLAEITKNGMNGYMAWQVKQLQEKITGQVMSSMHLTPDKIAAMPAAQRVAVEQQIMQQVAQELKQQMAEQMKKKNPNALGLDMMDSSGSSMVTSGGVNILA